MFKDKHKPYIKAAQIKRLCKQLGAQITSDYKDRDLVIVAVLKGSVIFFADLVREIKIPFETDFVRLSSYGHGTETSGVVKVLLDVSVSLRGKHVLVVEDILDTGITLNFFTDYLKKFSPASVEICTLLDKPSRRRIPLEAKYCGKKIEDHFVIGYGLDYKEICRNYADIYQVINL